MADCDHDWVLVKYETDNEGKVWAILACSKCPEVYRERIM